VITGLRHKFDICECRIAADHSVKESVLVQQLTEAICDQSHSK